MKYFLLSRVLTHVLFLIKIFPHARLSRGLILSSKDRRCFPPAFSYFLFSREITERVVISWWLCWCPQAARHGLSPFLGPPQRTSWAPTSYLQLMGTPRPRMGMPQEGVEPGLQAWCPLTPGQTLQADVEQNQINVSWFVGSV